MVKYIIPLILAVSSAFAFAQIETKGLTNAQVAELKAAAAQKAAENAKGGGQVTEALGFASAWGEQAAAAAEGFAKAMGIAARELNITINEFFNTPVGKITAVVIIWKVMGESIAAIFVGLMVITAGILVFRMLWKRIFHKEYKEFPKTYLWGLYTTTKRVPVHRPIGQLEEGEGFMLVLSLVILAFSLFVGGAWIT